ncbi:MAG: hypothetical protein QOF87_4090 [Pseudonocardiales bacterium]|nr:hypothetical protein [Pseudonocardiales bacterium]
MTTLQRTAVDQFLTAVESGEIAGCGVWRDDAVLDATVPNWRFQVTGADAIRAEYANQMVRRSRRIRATTPAADGGW